MNRIAQKLYDWLDKRYYGYNGDGGWNWKPGIAAALAGKLSRWLYRYFDIIPF